MNKQQRPTYVAIVGPWALLLSLALTWPFIEPGSLFLRDMVVPPSPALTDASLGLTEAAARALPQDALLAIAGMLIDASMLARVLLWTAMVVGGISAAYLVRRLFGAGLAGQLAATTMTLWNPFVVERLLQGQWTVVLAAVLLPAVAYFVSRGLYTAAIAAVTLCALTPTGAIVATIVAVVAAPRWRERFSAIGIGLAVSSSWLWVSFTNHSTSLTSDNAAGVAAFAARAEHGVGTVGALLGLGGIWNAETVPASRESGLWALSVVVLLALFAAGARWLRGRQKFALSGAAESMAEDSAHHYADRIHMATTRRLLLLGALALLLPMFFAFPPGINLLSWAVRTLPGAGLLRDTQKIVALAIPAYTLLAAAGAEALVALAHRSEAPARNQKPKWLSWRKPFAAAAALAVIVLGVPDAPVAVSPLKPQPLWPEWNVISGLVAQDYSSVAVLPAGSYRLIDGRPVLDPAQKILPANVLTTGNLLVSGAEVKGEGSVAAQIEAALLHGVSSASSVSSTSTDIVPLLANNGVGWVLVEDSPGPQGDAASALAQLDKVYDSDHLTLYRVPGAIEQPEPADRTGIYAALALWISLLVGSLIVALFAQTRRPRPGSEPDPQPQLCAAS